MAFEIKMTEKDNKYDTVVVEKVKIPNGTHIGWNTEVIFDDGVQGFATINRIPTILQSGFTIQNCFETAAGRKLTLPERIGNTQFVIYAYRQIIEGCSTGIRLPFVDVKDGLEKEFGSFWNFSLEIDNIETVIHRTALSEEGQLNVDQCSELFWDELNPFIKDALGKRLKEHSLVEIHAMINEICQEVLDTFRASGKAQNIGFDLKSFTLGRILND